MSKVATDWARRQALPDGTMKAVLRALAYIHQDGKLLYPSQSYLVRETGLGLRTVRDAIKALCQLGMLERRHRSAGAKGRTSDAYKLPLGREFLISKYDIRKARKALRNRHIVPVTGNSLPAPCSVPSGTSCRGIGVEQDIDTYQKGALTGQDINIGHGGGAVVVPLRKFAGAGK